MRFLADMGISQRIVEWLRTEGHDVKHLRDEGLQKLPNGEIFLKARTEKRIILTFDLDFGEILALSGKQDVSAVIFRLNNTTTPFVQERLKEVVAASGQKLQQGAIILVEEDRHRIRVLPVSET